MKWYVTSEVADAHSFVSLDGLATVALLIGSWDTMDGLDLRGYVVPSKDGFILAIRIAGNSELSYVAMKP